MASRELSILVTAKNMASRALGQVKSDIGGLQGASKRASANVSRNLGIAAAAVGGAFVGGVAAAVKLAGDFEAQMNTINTVAMKTPEELARIGETIRQVSRETGTPLADLTAAYYDLVSAGVSAADAQGVLRNANTLAIGGLGTTAETVDLLTTAMNAYSLDAAGVAVATDQFAMAIKNGKVTAAELGASFAQVAPTAKAYGIEIAELSAGYATLTAQGVPAAESATQMNAAIIALVRTTPAMEKLQKQTGKHYLAVAGSKGLAVAYQQLRADAEEAGVPLIELTGRLEGTSYALGVTGENAAKYEANLKSMGAATGTAAAQMGERQQGLNFQLTRLKTNLQDAGITIGSELIPQFADLAEEATGWLTGHQAEVKDFAASLAGGLRDAVGFARSLDWVAIGGVLESAGRFGKVITQAFLGMPPWIQTAVVTGWGLNKVAGGALGSLVGALGSGLIKGVLGMNAGVVNIKAATVVGPGGGMPGVGGAAGGGLRGAIAGGGLIGGLATGVAAASPLLAGAAAIEVVNFENMRSEQREKLGGILDELPRNRASIDDSIARIQEQIDMERPLLEGVLFNTNVRPQLEAEIRELQAVKAAQARTTAAARDAIPWAQRNVSAVQTSARQALYSASNQAGKLARIEGVNRESIGVQRGILAKKTSVTVSPIINTTVNVSLQEWQRVAVRSLRAASTSGASTLTAGV